MQPRLGIRWTIGDVTPNGFHALRLSLWGAWRLFGERAAYAVCVNTVSVDDAWARTGTVPPGVQWIEVDAGLVPAALHTRLDGKMADGVAWKFAPVRIFPERYELSLDNDCILWAMPQALSTWLRSERPSFVIAADVRPAFGQFASLCGPEPRNSGIRGLPPGFDLAGAMASLLDETGARLETELDEQGAQVATLLRSGPVHVVRTSEVTICSPFHPHQPGLGACGAHFVGLNTRRLGWKYDGVPAEQMVVEHWLRHRDELARRVFADAAVGSAGHGVA